MKKCGQRKLRRMIMASRPFRVDIKEDVLTDLRERLKRTRWPDEIPGSGWDYGSNLA